MTTDGFIGLCAVGVFCWIFWTARASTPPPSIDGTTPVPQAAAHISAWSSADDATDLYTVEDPLTHMPLAFYVRGSDHVLRLARDQPPLPAGDHGARILDQPQLSLGSSHGSLGALTGYFTGDLRTGHRGQTGFHYEPTAFLFDTIHFPSLALTPDLAGLGLTVTLPPHRFPTLSRFDLGCWEAAPFDGSHPALLYGAGFHLPLP